MLRISNHFVDVNKMVGMKAFLGEQMQKSDKRAAPPAAGRAARLVHIITFG